MIRQLLLALVTMLAVPAAAFAAEGGTKERVTEAMFVLIIGLLVLMAAIVAIEVRRQK